MRTDLRDELCQALDLLQCHAEPVFRAIVAMIRTAASQCRLLLQMRQQ